MNKSKYERIKRQHMTEYRRNISDVHSHINRYTQVRNTFIRNYIQMYRYKKHIRNEILHLLNKSVKPYIHENTLLGNYHDEHIEKIKTSFEIRQKQMKEGMIAQMMMGYFIGWENLEKGHSSGLDIRKKDNSIIIELKNKYNTCNSSSQKAILDKLVEYKKKNPNTRCIWGIINEKQNEKRLHKFIVHNGYIIEKIQGRRLLSIVFTLDGIDYTNHVINYVKNIMYSL